MSHLPGDPAVDWQFYQDKWKEALGAYEAKIFFWIVIYTLHQSKMAINVMIVIIHISSALHLMGKWRLTAGVWYFWTIRKRHSPLTGPVDNNVKLKTGNSVESWYWKKFGCNNYHYEENAGQHRVWQMVKSPFPVWERKGWVKMRTHTQEERKVENAVSAS